MEKRIIKFRAWNTEIKHMVLPELKFGRNLFPAYYQRESTFKISKTGKTKTEIVKEMVSVDYILQEPCFEVMQFTGLHDKNKKEIYEGDILQHEKYGSKGVMEWDNKNGCWTKFYPLCHFEVIGNIYENPELIK